MYSESEFVAVADCVAAVSVAVAVASMKCLLPHKHGLVVVVVVVEDSSESSNSVVVVVSLFDSSELTRFLSIIVI